MNSERFGRALLQMRFPTHREQIAAHASPSFALLCEVYGMASEIREDLRHSANADPIVLDEIEAVCIELETDAEQLLDGSTIEPRR